MVRHISASMLALSLVLPVPSQAEVPEATVQSLSAPDTIQTRIGTLEFEDGVPTADTAKAVYDTLDFTRALDVYSNSFRGASFAVRKSELASISSEKMTTPPVPATSSMPL